MIFAAPRFAVRLGIFHHSVAMLGQHSGRNACLCVRVKLFGRSHAHDKRRFFRFYSGHDAELGPNPLRRHSDKCLASGRLGRNVLVIGN